jgi:hypothetical protein
MMAAMTVNGMPAGRLIYGQLIHRLLGHFKQTGSNPIRKRQQRKATAGDRLQGVADGPVNGAEKIGFDVVPVMPKPRHPATQLRRNLDPKRACLQAMPRHGGHFGSGGKE